MWWWLARGSLVPGRGHDAVQVEEKKGERRKIERGKDRMGVIYMYMNVGV